jgi:DinB superfamily
VRQVVLVIDQLPWRDATEQNSSSRPLASFAILIAEMDQRADVIAQSIAYRDMELAMLGARDPADVQSETPRRVEELMERAGTVWHRSPRPDDWSAQQLLAHLVDIEIIFSGRYRWILAHDRPPLVGFDQTLWMEHLHSADEDPDDLMAAFLVLRRLNVGLWKRASPAERARAAIHPERGEESFDVCFRMVAGHDLLHLDQMTEAITQADRTPEEP